MSQPKLTAENYRVLVDRLVNAQATLTELNDDPRSTGEERSEARSERDALHAEVIRRLAAATPAPAQEKLSAEDYRRLANEADVLKNRVWLEVGHRLPSYQLQNVQTAAREYARQLQMVAQYLDKPEDV